MEWEWERCLGEGSRDEGASGRVVKEESRSYLEKNSDDGRSVGEATGVWLSLLPALVACSDKHFPIKAHRVRRFGAD
jgi:hypothetical protein